MRAIISGPPFADSSGSAASLSGVIAPTASPRSPSSSERRERARPRRPRPRSYGHAVASPCRTRPRVSAAAHRHRRQHARGPDPRRSLGARLERIARCAAASSAAARAWVATRELARTIPGGRTRGLKRGLGCTLLRRALARTTDDRREAVPAEGRPGAAPEVLAASVPLGRGCHPNPVRPGRSRVGGARRLNGAPARQLGEQVPGSLAAAQARLTQSSTTFVNSPFERRRCSRSLSGVSNEQAGASFASHPPASELATDPSPSRSVTRARWRREPAARAEADAA
jgi:hypothetical protein